MPPIFTFIFVFFCPYLFCSVLISSRLLNTPSYLIFHFHSSLHILYATTNNCGIRIKVRLGVLLFEHFEKSISTFVVQKNMNSVCMFMLHKYFLFINYIYVMKRLDLYIDYIYILYIYLHCIATSLSWSSWPQHQLT